MLVLTIPLWTWLVGEANPDVYMSDSHAAQRRGAQRVFDAAREAVFPQGQGQHHFRAAQRPKDETPACVRNFRWCLTLRQTMVIALSGVFSGEERDTIRDTGKFPNRGQVSARHYDGLRDTVHLEIKRLYKKAGLQEPTEKDLPSRDAIKEAAKH